MSMLQHRLCPSMVPAKVVTHLPHCPNRDLPGVASLMLGVFHLRCDSAESSRIEPGDTSEETHSQVE
jgi:hypothetical protein